MLPRDCVILIASLPNCYFFGCGHRTVQTRDLQTMDVACRRLLRKMMTRLVVLIGRTRGMKSYTFGLTECPAPLFTTACNPLFALKEAAIAQSMQYIFQTCMYLYSTCSQRYSTRLTAESRGRFRMHDFLKNWSGYSSLVSSFSRVFM